MQVGCSCRFRGGPASSGGISGTIRSVDLAAACLCCKKSALGERMNVVVIAIGTIGIWVMVAKTRQWIRESWVSEVPLCKSPRSAAC